MTDYDGPRDYRDDYRDYRDNTSPPRDYPAYGPPPQGPKQQGGVVVGIAVALVLAGVGGWWMFKSHDTDSSEPEDSVYGSSRPLSGDRIPVPSPGKGKADYTDSDGTEYDLYPGVPAHDAGMVALSRVDWGNPRVDVVPIYDSMDAKFTQDVNDCSSLLAVKENGDPAPQQAPFMRCVYRAGHGRLVLLRVGRS